MHLLRYIIIFFILMPVISCKSKGPLSPEEAFIALKDAYLKSDAGRIEQLLSEGSIARIRKMIMMISSMPDFQLEALGKSFNTNADTLRNLSVKDYLSLQLSLSNKIGEDTFKEITNYNIVGIDQKDSIANVRIENGMELVFVKEGPYWKFDMDELSSKK